VDSLLPPKEKTRPTSSRTTRNDDVGGEVEKGESDVQWKGVGAQGRQVFVSAWEGEGAG
jgi:hypothetical protein